MPDVVVGVATEAFLSFADVVVFRLVNEVYVEVAELAAASAVEVVVLAVVDDVLLAVAEEVLVATVHETVVVRVVD